MFIIHFSNANKHYVLNLFKNFQDLHQLLYFRCMFYSLISHKLIFDCFKWGSNLCITNDHFEIFITFKYLEIFNLKWLWQMLLFHLAENIKLLHPNCNWILHDNLFMIGYRHIDLEWKDSLSLVFCHGYNFNQIQTVVFSFVIIYYLKEKRSFSLS